jgi:DNA (cytosine-5)-methyltransferase 1
MLRVVALLRPRWVLAENVAGIINMALDDVLSDLEGQGYETGTIVLPACAVNAPHRRDRVWIVAHADNGRSARDMGEAVSEGQGQTTPTAESCSRSEDRNAVLGVECREDVADTDERQCQYENGPVRTGRYAAASSSWWAVEPDVAHGVPHRVDRLRCLGNAIVPQVAYEILKAIANLTYCDMARKRIAGQAELL